MTMQDEAEQECIPKKGQIRKLKRISLAAKWKETQQQKDEEQNKRSVRVTTFAASHSDSTLHRKQNAGGFSLCLQCCAVEGLEMLAQAERSEAHNEKRTTDRTLFLLLLHTAAQAGIQAVT